MDVECSKKNAQRLSFFFQFSGRQYMQLSAKFNLLNIPPFKVNQKLCLYVGISNHFYFYFWFTTLSSRPYLVHKIYSTECNQRRRKLSPFRKLVHKLNCHLDNTRIIKTRCFRLLQRFQIKQGSQALYNDWSYPLFQKCYQQKTIATSFHLSWNYANACNYNILVHIF